MKRQIKWIIIVCVLLCASGFVYSWMVKGKEFVAEYVTVPLSRTDLRISIDATGTIEPVKLIEVGAQVSGKIVEFAKDENGNEVDYASYVKKGQLIARIDDELPAREVRKAEAAVRQAAANVMSSKANLLQAKANYAQAKADRNRAEHLGPGKALAQATYDQYIFAEESSAAAVAQAEASIAQAEASLASSEESLAKERQNMTYTEIVSPVDGLVVIRNVELGQTVVSSMSAPLLFQIATDPIKIQIWAAVNEADIGNIKKGQKVLFSVDAFPGKEFEGKVNKIRPNATMSSNVVSYVVEVDADNPGRQLLLYLTADVKFIVHDWHDVLVTPNAALRFEPKKPMVRPEVWSKYQKERRAMLEQEDAPSIGKGERKTVLWVKDGDKFVRPLWVYAGETNSIVTPIRPVNDKEKLDASQQVVIKADILSGQEEEVEEAGAGQKSLFAPARMSRGGRR